MTASYAAAAEPPTVEPTDSSLLDTIVSKAINATRFDELAGIIKTGLQSDFAVGAALEELQRNRVYKPRYSDFATCCRDEWQLSKSRAYQLIHAAKVLRVVSTTVDILPFNEAQVRVMAKLPDGEWAEAWQAAVDFARVRPGGRPTAEDVAYIVNKRLGAQTPAVHSESEEELVECSCSSSVPKRDGSEWFCEHCLEPLGPEASHTANITTLHASPAIHADWKAGKLTMSEAVERALIEQQYGLQALKAIDSGDTDAALEMMVSHTRKATEVVEVREVESLGDSACGKAANGQHSWDRDDDGVFCTLCKCSHDPAIDGPHGIDDDAEGQSDDVVDLSVPVRFTSWHDAAWVALDTITAKNASKEQRTECRELLLDIARKLDAIAAGSAVVS